MTKSVAVHMLFSALLVGIVTPRSAAAVEVFDAAPPSAGGLLNVSSSSAARTGSIQILFLGSNAREVVLFDPTTPSFLYEAMSFGRADERVDGSSFHLLAGSNWSNGETVLPRAGKDRQFRCHGPYWFCIAREGDDTGKCIEGSCSKDEELNVKRRGRSAEEVWDKVTEPLHEKYVAVVTAGLEASGKKLPKGYFFASHFERVVCEATGN